MPVIRSPKIAQIGGPFGVHVQLKLLGTVGEGLQSRQNILMGEQVVVDNFPRLGNVVAHLLIAALATFLEGLFDTSQRRQQFAVTVTKLLHRGGKGVAHAGQLQRATRQLVAKLGQLTGALLNAVTQTLTQLLESIAAVSEQLLNRFALRLTVVAQAIGQTGQLRH